MPIQIAVRVGIWLGRLALAALAANSSGCVIEHSKMRWSSEGASGDMETSSTNGAGKFNTDGTCPDDEYVHAKVKDTLSGLCGGDYSFEITSGSLKCSSGKFAVAGTYKCR